MYRKLYGVHNVIVYRDEVLENLKQEFRGTVSWNKYRSEIKAQTKNNNLECMIDPTFRNNNWLFLLSF